jgi:hypothetical protein
MKANGADSVEFRTIFDTLALGTYEKSKFLLFRDLK